MVIKISIDCECADLHDNLYMGLERILKTIPKKLFKQLERDGRCICTAKESADLLKDLNGNTVGTLEVVK